MIGVVLVLLSMTVGAKAIAAADDTVPMYAAVASLVPGQPVTQHDVRVSTCSSAQTASGMWTAPCWPAGRWRKLRPTRRYGSPWWLWRVR